MTPQILLSHVLWISPNETHYLNHMKYHDVSIENTCCRQPPSIVTKSLRIYDHFKVSPIDQNLILILVTNSIFT